MSPIGDKRPDGRKDQEGRKRPGKMITCVNKRPRTDQEGNDRVKRGQLTPNDRTDGRKEGRKRPDGRKEGNRAKWERA